MGAALHTDNLLVSSLTGHRLGKPVAEEAEVGSGGGANIWIPGPEPAFFPCECERTGSQESYEEAAGPHPTPP